MAVRKTKMFEQHDLVNYSVYRVVNLTNRTDPIIGTELKKAGGRFARRRLAQEVISSILKNSWKVQRVGSITCGETNVSR